MFIAHPKICFSRVFPFDSWMKHSNLMTVAAAAPHQKRSEPQVSFQCQINKPIFRSAFCYSAVQCDIFTTDILFLRRPLMVTFAYLSSSGTLWTARFWRHHKCENSGRRKRACLTSNWSLGKHKQDSEWAKQEIFNFFLLWKKIAKKERKSVQSGKTF